MPGIATFLLYGLAPDSYRFDPCETRGVTPRLRLRLEEREPGDQDTHLAAQSRRHNALRQRAVHQARASHLGVRRNPTVTREGKRMKPVNIDFAAARRVVEATKPCLLPVEQAEVLPAEAYTSEAFWEFEKHAIFSREWLCIGHVNEVPQVAD